MPKLLIRPVAGLPLTQFMLGGLLAITVFAGKKGFAADQPVDYELLLEQIAALEATSSPTDPALVETLTAIAEAATALQLYSQAAEQLGRAIQIRRRNAGLFDAGQVPLYFELIDVQTRAGNWAAVNQSLGYLYWLVREKQALGGDALVDSLIRLAGYHLMGVARDAPQQQPGHYLQAEELTYQALTSSERLWGRADPRRSELYYSLIKQLHLQSIAVDLGGDTGYRLRAVVPGSSWVRPDRTVQTEYFQTGNRLLNEMEEYLAAGSDDPQQFLAMLALYRADWNLLFDREDPAAAYRDAFAALAAAGEDVTVLNRFFSRPQILPAPEFHGSFADALAAADPRTAITDSPGASNPADFYFQDWFGAMPYVPFPDTVPALDRSLTADFDTVTLQFRLDALNPVSRWVKGTYQTRNGVMADYQPLREADNPGVDSELLNARLHALRFRPVLENGEARPFEGALTYRVAVDSLQP